MSWVDEEKLLNYRINMRNKLEEMLEENNRVAMQEPTGIGKSYMMIEMCKEKEGNKIIFEPTRVLADRFENELKGTNTKVMIYRNLIGLSSIDLENMFKNTNYLFLDEVHRIGAEQWGKQIEKVFKMFPEMKIIGLTATPLRTDKINVFTEFFDDIQTEPMDLLTAINEHLLPQITYVTAYASIMKEVESRKEAIRQSKSLFSETKNEYLRVLETHRHKFKSIMNIPKILKKYIKSEKINNENFKVLLFVSRLNQIDEAEKESLKWFKEAFPEKKINIYKLKNVGREKNKKEVENFENNKNINEIDVMISVNKLIEGFHIKKVSSAIFLRRTCSNIVFLQQIGRTLSESEPIIFDFVENHKSIGNGLEQDFDEFKKNIKNYSSTNKDNKIDKPIIWMNDELLETEEIFSKIKYNSNFTEEEKKILDEYKDIYTSKELVELGLIKNREPHLISAYYYRNKIPHKMENRSTREIILEVKAYADQGLSTFEISKITGIKHSKIKSICKTNNDIIKLKLNKTDQKERKEIALKIIEDYTEKGYNLLEISEIIGEKTSYLRSLCNYYGINYNKAKSCIFDKYKEEIIDLASRDFTIPEINEKLNLDVSEKYLREYCNKNDIKVISFYDKRMKIIKQLNEEGKTIKEISKIVGIKTPTNITKYLKELGLKPNTRHNKIIEKLRKDIFNNKTNFQKLKELTSLNEICCITAMKEFGIKKEYNKHFLELCNEYGIKFITKNELSKNKEEEILELYNAGISNSKIHEITGIDRSTIKLFIERNGLETRYLTSEERSERIKKALKNSANSKIENNENLKKYLIENSMEKDLKTLSEETGINRCGIGKFFKRNNIHYMNERIKI